jgi:hypothetical protein
MDIGRMFPGILRRKSPSSKSSAEPLIGPPDSIDSFFVRFEWQFG